MFDKLRTKNVSLVLLFLWIFTIGVIIKFYSDLFPLFGPRLGSSTAGPTELANLLFFALHLLVVISISVNITLAATKNYLASSVWSLVSITILLASIGYLNSSLAIKDYSYHPIYAPQSPRN